MNLPRTDSPSMHPIYFKVGVKGQLFCSFRPNYSYFPELLTFLIWEPSAAPLLSNDDFLPTIRKKKKKKKKKKKNIFVKYTPSVGTTDLTSKLYFLLPFHLGKNNSLFLLIFQTYDTISRPFLCSRKWVSHIWMNLINKKVTLLKSGIVQKIIGHNELIIRLETIKIDLL